MIRAGFLDPESRRDLIELTQNGSVEHRLARRANALVLLNDGMSCEAIAKSLPLRRRGSCSSTTTRYAAGIGYIRKTASMVWRALVLAAARAA